MLDTKPIAPPDELLAGRRSLDVIPELKILEDLHWDELSKKWVLQVQLNIDNRAGGFVDQVTDWFVCIDPRYPHGSISVYPSRTQSLTVTFQHQLLNIETDDLRWRKGKLCLDTSVRALGKHGPDNAPLDTDWGLHWHLSRTIRWLTMAAKDLLAQAGDPFELPHCRSESPSIVVAEANDTFSAWSGTTCTYGSVEFIRIKGTDMRFARAFKTPKGSSIHKIVWGKYIEDNSEPVTPGIWVTIPSLPIIHPWRLPEN